MNSDNIASQSGSAWLRWRSLGIGSSDIASILGISPWKSKEELFNERTGRVKAVDISNQFQVQRGVQNEPKARALFELIAGRDFPPALHVHPEFEFMRVSLDGDDGETVLEIKVPGVKTVEEAQKGIVPPYYMCQIQYQMLVAQRKKAIFFCYHPEKDMHAIVNIDPDLAMQEDIKNQVTEFWGMIQRNEFSGDTDFAEMNDKSFDLASQLWLEGQANIKKGEKQIAEAEAILLQYKELHAKEIRGSFIKIIKSQVKGSIEYAKIPALQGLDLEAFRKPMATRISIKAVK